MKDIDFINDINIHFDDEAKRNKYDVSMRITQYFENGKAIHIKLDEAQVDCLYKKLQHIKSL